MSYRDDDKNLLLTRKMADVQKALEKYEDVSTPYVLYLALIICKHT